MYRKIEEKLTEWKKTKGRKPLIIKGSRQVGKTFILKEWGSQSFSKVHYLNFEKNPQLGKIFERDFEVTRMLTDLQLALNCTIDTTKHLLIFDEIQECPRAMTSLKYFCEDCPELAICAAGSLLGVTLSEESFPVGKVSFLYLHPLDFEEFLQAVDLKKGYDFLPKQISLNASISEFSHAHLWEMLKIYYVTGGMPEVVKTFSENQKNFHDAFNKVRKIQADIITSYEQDFAKHAGKVNAVHIQALYRNVPMQLSETHDDSTKRFKFNEVMAGKKGFVSWERPLHWLINAGLVLQVKIANSAQLPLEHYCKPNFFKLFIHDCGLLGSMLQLAPEDLLDQDYGIAKGFFAENFVAQALYSSNELESSRLYSWQEGTAQIEFVRGYKSEIIPIEVKSGYRTKAKSLTQFQARFNPSLSIKISAQNLSYEPKQKLLNLPLYLSHWAALF